MMLTFNMKADLLYMRVHNGISYAHDKDRTQMALMARGLTVLSRGRKYGKTHWSLTNNGRKVVEAMVAKAEATKEFTDD
jgi:hypothetical protein